MTVAEVFEAANLSPCGPVPWKDRDRPVPEARSGVYVVARTNDPHLSCEPCELFFVEGRCEGLILDLEYERRRWQCNEPVLYVGQTGQPLRKRLNQFYNHHCGDSGPHAGGQVILLLPCNLWVFWSPAEYPLEAEGKMLAAFKGGTGGLPFGNADRGRPPRIQ